MTLEAPAVVVAGDALMDLTPRPRSVANSRTSLIQADRVSMLQSA
jgi:hypothetical protein